MGVRLTVKKRGERGGDEKPHVVTLDDETINLGRDGTCQVVLAQQAVSRNHARISKDGALFFVEDLGSSFGTTINGEKLKKGEKHLLRNGDTIAIAQFDVTFDRVADLGEEGDEANKTSFLSRKVVKDVMKGLGSGGELPYFRLMNGPNEGKHIEISDAQEYTFGRDDGADIVLQDDLVSRRHAKVRRDWSGTHVEDLQSRNGIKVNKKKTLKATLKDRDELEVGGVRMLYIDPTEVRETPVIAPSVDEDAESTMAVKDEDKPPEPAAPPPEEPKPEEPVSSPSEPAVDGPRASLSDAPGMDEPGSLPEPGDDEVPEDGGGGFSIDLKSRQTQIALVVAGVFGVLAIVLIVLLIAGA
jgi:pSer/pThr/pTyr-binding forkhead associated (FHA) protein